MLKVSVIIPTYKDWHRLSLCLDALAAQSFDQALFEVIVVNNAPEDPAPQSYRLAENVVIITESKAGSYAARNAGLKICKGEIIGFTDSDCVPDKNWIKSAVDLFEKNQEVKRIGGAIHMFYKNETPSKIELYDKIFAFPQERYVEAGNAVTANMFTYLSVFKEIGYFDDSLMSGGDHQWGMMAQEKGFRIVYAPNAIVNHPARSTLSELVIKAKRVGRGQASFIQKRSGLRLIGNLIMVFRPKTWEAKRVFKEGKDMGFLDKVYVIFLRHIILWTMDLSRIKTQIKGISK